MVSLAISKSNCLGCGKPVDVIELEGFPTPRPHCLGCILKDTQEAEDAKPKLMRGMEYRIRVSAFNEARHEGCFSPVVVRFRNVFLGWIEREDGDEYALFDNGVEIGPRKELGYSWHAVQI